METLFLTGATGFVGRNLMLRALASGMQVLAPVRNVEKLYTQLAAEGVSPHAVIPLPLDPAAWPTLRPTYAVLSAGVLFARNREEYFRTNVVWNRELLRALPDCSKTVILSSQSAGGPTPAGKKMRTESDRDEPVTWYGQSKLALEHTILHEFPKRAVTILRPAMILGARDNATLPLFKMARGLIRTKPGLNNKWFSYLSVDDVVSAIFAAFTLSSRGPFYICAESAVSDRELIEATARTLGKRGITISIPLFLVKILAKIVDAVPSFRESVPSLTRDRFREILAHRWVVDASAFRHAADWNARISLAEALDSACRHFQSCKQL